jgi:hypothetical protein
VRQGRPVARRQHVGADQQRLGRLQLALLDQICGQGDLGRRMVADQGQRAPEGRLAGGQIAPLGQQGAQHGVSLRIAIV